MSNEENKKERGLPEIQQEFQQACLKAGHLQYQIYAFQRDLDMVNETIKDLNFEAASVHAQEQEKTKEENK